MHGYDTISQGTILSADLSTHTHTHTHKEHILGVTNCRACDACHKVTHPFAWDADTQVKG